MVQFARWKSTLYGSITPTSNGEHRITGLTLRGPRRVKYRPNYFGTSFCSHWRVYILKFAVAPPLDPSFFIFMQFLFSKIWQNNRLIKSAVTDPGFTRLGHQHQRWTPSVIPIIWQFLSENSIKMKEIERRGGRVHGAPFDSFTRLEDSWKRDCHQTRERSRFLLTSR